jgi:Rps23 Pro-64 3,4-dihydroxylase Tpa1-like proline 4-hydroxylase
VLGLTDEPWPADHGGHLEFLAVDGDALIVTERRPPGWNTLDLFDVTGTACLHQVPIVTCDVERRAITGWFF